MGYKGSYTRVCKDCGKVMGNVHPSKQYCPECKEKRHKQQTAKWWKQKNEEIRTTRPKPVKYSKTAEERDIAFRADCRAADKLGISYGKYMLRKMQANKKLAGAGIPASAMGDGFSTSHYPDNNTKSENLQ